jgi:hypothetical protein
LAHFSVSSKPPLLIIVPLAVPPYSMNCEPPLLIVVSIAIPLLMV